MEYVSVNMVEYQDDLVQEEWPDLLSSLDAKEWKILETNSSYDLDVEQAAKQLLGEKLVIRGWRDLQEYQGELLWEAWSKSDQNIALDQFIEEQIQNHIQKKTLASIPVAVTFFAATTGAKPALPTMFRTWVLGLPSMARYLHAFHLSMKREGICLPMSR